jgi:4-amino-4-deoxy-L-arabinose transferase-like glycosyltransferase
MRPPAHSESRFRETLFLLILVSLSLLIRLIKISQPYVDQWSFKQGTIAMIAENFYRNGFNFFYPQINWAGASAGYIGTEFPLVPFLASLLYVPFGVHEWIGRSISVAFFTLSLPFFYFLVKHTANQRSAAFAAVIYGLAPLSIFTSRSFMSDMTSLSFSVVALYAFVRWVERSDSFALLASASLAAAMFAGMFIPCRAKYSRVFHWWLIANCLFVFIAGHGNRHPWYQLPMVPIAAALGGRTFDFALKRLAALTASTAVQGAAGAVLLCALAFSSYLYVKPLYEPWAIPLQEAGKNIDRIAPPKALAIFVADGDSSEIYYSRRKGWHAFDDNNWGEPLDSEQAIADLEKLRRRGASYLVFTRYTDWWLDYYRDFQKYLDARYRRVLQTEDYTIFDLTPPRAEPVRTTQANPPL